MAKVLITFVALAAESRHAIGSTPPCAVFGWGYDDPQQFPLVNSGYVDDPALCQQSCASNQTCSAWTWYRNSKGCWHFPDGVPEKRINGTVSGPKACPSQAASAPATVRPGKAKLPGVDTHREEDWKDWLQGHSLMIFLGILLCGVLGCILASMHQRFDDEAQSPSKSHRKKRSAKNAEEDTEATEREAVGVTTPLMAVPASKEIELARSSASPEQQLHAKGLAVTPQPAAAPPVATQRAVGAVGAQPSLFDKIDSNHDGVLSPGEWGAAFGVPVMRPQQVLAPATTVMAAPVTTVRAASTMVATPSPSSPPTATMQVASPQAQPSLFDRIDRNHDGVLSRGEFGAAFGAPAVPQQAPLPPVATMAPPPPVHTLPAATVATSVAIPTAQSPGRGAAAGLSVSRSSVGPPAATVSTRQAQPSLFDRLDANHDGIVSRQEFRAGFGVAGGASG